MNRGPPHTPLELAQAETLGDDGSPYALSRAPAPVDPDGPPQIPGLAVTQANTQANPWSESSGLFAADGQRFGRYVILAKLGEGAMGEVFSGYDRELDRRVALKLLRARRADDPLSRTRMQREAQALAKLSHPNVVQVHDVGEFGSQQFVAMEYVVGETLDVWQACHDPATPAGRQAILEMYIQAGRGLAAAHAAGIIHRDFKPKSRRPSQTAPQPTDRPHSRELGRFERVSLLRLAPHCPALPQVLAKRWQCP